MLIAFPIALCGALACGEAEKEERTRPEPFQLTLDFYPAPWHAGIFIAQERGYFADVGLDVSIHTPITPRLPVKYVNDRIVDLALTSEPQLMVARAKGVPVIAVRTLLAGPTASMIWSKGSGIGGIADLKGETIGIAGLPAEEALLKAILAQANLSLEDVEMSIVDYTAVSALTNGRVDAILARNVDAIQLRSLGLRAVVIPLTKLGIPIYDESVLIARADRLRRDPTTIRAFMEAVARGTDAAVENPGAATSAIQRANNEFAPKAVAAAVAATVPLLSRTGWMDARSWRRFAVWIERRGLTDGKSLSSRLLTNEYLASGGSG